MITGSEKAQEPARQKLPTVLRDRIRVKAHRIRDVPVPLPLRGKENHPGPIRYFLHTLASVTAKLATLKGIQLDRGRYQRHPSGSCRSAYPSRTPGTRAASHASRPRERIPNRPPSTRETRDCSARNGAEPGSDPSQNLTARYTIGKIFKKRKRTQTRRHTERDQSP